MPDRNSSFIYENPAVEQAAEAIKTAISGRKMLIIAGNCWVDYRGRASSTLNPGERVLIIKEDGSVLVHRTKGYEPVNWQPPGCIFHTSWKNNVILIKAIRRRPHETLAVYFDRIYLLAVLGLVDKGEFSLYASEEDMQGDIASTVDS